MLDRLDKEGGAHLGSSRGKSFQVGHARVDDVTMSEALEAIAEMIEDGRGGTDFTPNVDHVVRLEDDAHLRRAYASVSLSLADGMPIVWSSRLLGPALREKVSGSDLVMPLMRLAAERKYWVYLVGGGEDVAARAAERLMQEIPGLAIVGVDTRRIDVNDEPSDYDDLVAAIQAARTDIVLLALGCPGKDACAPDRGPAAARGVYRRGREP